MKMIKVAIVDDHKMFRDGVISILNEVDDINPIWSASNSAETLKLLNDQIPDVLMMDLSLGEESGFTLTSQILEKYQAIKILVLSMHHEDSYIIHILELGARGYILKEAGSDEMIRAIRVVSNGDTYYSKHVSEVLIKNITSGTRPKSNTPQIDLTKREIEILKLIAEEFSNPEIADMLYISVRTVDTHRRNLLDKLGVKNTAGMVKYAIKHGIVNS
jgi:DNA-binding NarL/FixJ family response regulator